MQARLGWLRIISITYILIYFSPLFYILGETTFDRMQCNAAPHNINLLALCHLQRTLSPDIYYLDLMEIACL